MRLVPLGPEHAAAILAGQDTALEREVHGTRWQESELLAFLDRAQRWSADGPLREFAALGEDGTLIGTGGIHRVGSGLDRGEAALVYGLLPDHRGRGEGHRLARMLGDLARADPRIHTIVLRIAPENAASRAVAVGIGARRTAATEPHPADARRIVERWTLPLSDPPR